MNFKAWDKVECTEGTNFWQRLYTGAIYTVKKEVSWGVMLEEKWKYLYSGIRFKLHKEKYTTLSKKISFNTDIENVAQRYEDWVKQSKDFKVGDYVKCIDPTDTLRAWQVYKISYIVGELLKLNNQYKTKYKKHRFIKVEGKEFINNNNKIMNTYETIKNEKFLKENSSKITTTIDSIEEVLNKLDEVNKNISDKYIKVKGVQRELSTALEQNNIKEIERIIKEVPQIAEFLNTFAKQKISSIMGEEECSEFNVAEFFKN